MQKTAQKRSILNKIKEMSNISGIAAEKFFNPEFEKVMTSLRSADDKMRAIASGKQIEGEDPGDPTSLKELLKSAKSNLNRREYMTSVASLGRFHKKLYEIVKVIDGLNTNVDQVHHDFLFKELDEDQKKYLSDIKGRFATTRSYNLVSQAGIMDFLHNISSERGKALAAWEKRYPKQVGKLKKDTSNLLGKSESILASLLSVFKEMATARAARKVDDYVRGTAKIASIYNNYDKTFRDYYTDNVKGFLDKQELLSPTKKVEDKELGSQEVPVNAPSDAEPPSFEAELNVEEAPTPSVVPNTIPSPPPDVNVEEAYNDVLTPNSTTLAPQKIPADLAAKIQTVPMPEIMDVDESELEQTNEIAPPKSAHVKFVASLESMANEKPAFIAAHIRRYATLIQSTDAETAVKLFKLARSIKE